VLLAAAESGLGMLGEALGLGPLAPLAAGVIRQQAERWLPGRPDSRPSVTGVLQAGDLALYLALGGLAIAGAVEWPVAVAAAAGFGLARQCGQPRSPV
jgi:hypothetical protein